MNIPQDVIEQATQAILNSRELCGDEQLAAFEILAELGYRNSRSEIYRIANFRANARWNTYKKQAGVNPKYTW